jgi:hypothetical protein
MAKPKKSEKKSKPKQDLAPPATNRFIDIKRSESPDDIGPERAKLNKKLRKLLKQAGLKQARSLLKLCETHHWLAMAGVLSLVQAEVQRWAVEFKNSVRGAEMVRSMKLAKKLDTAYLDLERTMP